MDIENFKTGVSGQFDLEGESGDIMISGYKVIESPSFSYEQVIDELYQSAVRVCGIPKEFLEGPIDVRSGAAEYIKYEKMRGLK